MTASAKNYYLDGDYDLLFQDNQNSILYKSAYSMDNASSKYKSIEISSEDQYKVYEQAFSGIIDFYNKNDTFFKKFENDIGINVWFLEHFRLYFNYRNLLLKISCINEFIQKENNGIIITSDKRLFNYFDKDKIEFKTSKTQSKRQDHYRIISELIYIILKFRFKLPHLKKHVLLSNFSDISNGVNKRFGNLEHEFSVIINRELFNSSQKLSSYESIPKKKISSDNILSNYLFSGKVIFDFFKIRKSIKLLKDSLEEQGFNSVERTINNLFWKSKSSIFMYYAKYRSFNVYFKKSNISSILINDENSPQQKVVQYAAILNKVNCFGIQHGNIHEFHPAYIYKRYNSKPVLPDVTFTWGEHFTNLLLDRGGYREEQVYTSGRITLEKEYRHYNKIIETEKKLILYASQPQRDPLMRKKHLSDVLLAFKEVSVSHKLIIRPHPREKEDTYFNEVGKDIGVEDFIIDRKSDLKTHMEKCDLLITSFSTVGTEFIPYYKPLLVLDYLKQDLAGWIKEGVGFPLYSREELIKKLKTPELKVNKEKCDNFVKNYFYKIDNEASARVKDVIYKKNR